MTISFEDMCKANVTLEDTENSSNSLFEDNLHIFLDCLFGRKRLLVLRVCNNKSSVMKELKKYCIQNRLELTYLDSGTLTVDIIRGEIEILTDGTYKRKTPAYISDGKQMIIVKNTNENVDIEVLRAFCYMGFLDSYNNETGNIPIDKLPYGSAYIFLADDDFPTNKFILISSYWQDESAVIDLRDFRTKVIEHLCKLNISEKIIRIYKGHEHDYYHILPDNKSKFNILLKYRDSFYSSVYCKSIQFHKDFSHLNSSQALCINFFYPLLIENSLDIILNILGIEGNVDYNNTCFEKISELEQSSSKKTNFDFFIKTNSGINIYFEIKYTENEFGTAEKNQGHSEKYEKTYKKLLLENPAINDEMKDEVYFIKNYQIMRNLIHIGKNSYVVFIYPKENGNIRNASLEARRNIITESWKKHFILFTWEDLIDQLEKSIDSKQLISYYKDEFYHKYFSYLNS